MLVAFTIREGWISFLDTKAAESAKSCSSPAAVLYEDGWVYDFVLKRLGYNPWRKCGVWPCTVDD